MKRLIAVLAALVLCMMLGSGLAVSAAPDTGIADLTVVSLDWTGGDGQVKPGTKLTFSVKVKNTGTVAASAFAVDIQFGTDRLFRLTQAGGLAAGQTVTLTSPVWAAVKGDKMISARADAADTVFEVSEKNNSKQINLRVAADRYEPADEAAKEAVTQAGMFDLTFSDDFDSLASVDQQSTGKEGYKWYVKRRWAQSDMTPDDYFVKDGVLTLQSHDNPYTIGASTVDCETHVGYTFKQGYIEVRLRMPHAVTTDGEAGKTAIWSVPLENWAEGLTGGRYVEADWYEYYGQPGKQYYGVTLHDLENTPNGRNWSSGSRRFDDGLADEEWHTMGWLWDAGSLQCFYDGVPTYYQTWSKNDVPIPINKVESGELRFDGVFSPIDQWDMMLFIAGMDNLPLELDYVRIWQKGGDKPVVTPSTTTPTTKKTTAATTTKQATTTKKPTTITTVTTTATALAPTAVDTVTTVSSTTVPTDTPAATAAPTVTPTATAAVDTSPRETDDGLPGWLLGVILGAVVIVLGTTVAGVLIIKKKKSK